MLLNLPQYFILGLSFAVGAHSLTAVPVPLLKLGCPNRLLLEELETWCRSPEAVPFRATTPWNGVDDWERDLAEHLATLEQQTRAWLCTDVQRLVGEFTAAIKMPDVEVKLELQEQGKCTRYHTDKVPCRLLCTYAGKGTEVLDDDHVDWHALRHCKLPPPAANKIISRQQEPYSSQPGEALLFYNMNKLQHPAVHKSPTLEEGSTAIDKVERSTAQAAMKQLATEAATCRAIMEQSVHAQQLVGYLDSSLFVHYRWRCTCFTGLMPVASTALKET